MSKLYKLERKDAGYVNYYFYCPGCKHSHRYETPRWTFDAIKISFTPSLLEYYTHPQTKRQVTVCHLFVTNGRLAFCGDCPHELKGQTVDMVDFPPDYGLPDGAEAVY